ncbi:hypothetical protein PsalN5692_00872 [Piscirickettsia salmonis]|nr:hypothetical protein PsalN5692_00872 [Piscirickettsia salmonis]
MRWYGRYALSYRDLKEMVAERGLEIERSTICRWVHEYGPEVAKRLRPHFRQTCASWRLDETLVKVKGRWYYTFIERLINMATLWIGCSVVSNMLKRPCAFSKRQ